jgi:hypothetical protein
MEETNGIKKTTDNHRVSIIQPSEHNMTAKIRLLDEGSIPPSDFFLDYNMSNYFHTNKSVTNQSSSN